MIRPGALSSIPLGIANWSASTVIASSTCVDLRRGQRALCCAATNDGQVIMYHDELHPCMHGIVWLVLT